MSDSAYAYYTCSKCHGNFEKQWHSKPWFGDYSISCPGCKKRGKHKTLYPVSVMHGWDLRERMNYCD